jgi:hypothetical protein
LAAAGTIVAAPAPTASAQTAYVRRARSANWAGYVVGGTKFSGVSGGWVVPAASSASAGYSAFWVGLGGATSTSSALEQVGTESDYVRGRARYRAWYELVPYASARLRLTVRPGDRVFASVRVSGSRVTVRLSDLSTGKSVRRTRHMSDPDTSSADWITEAPSAVYADGGYRILPLADFGTVAFSDALATAAGHTGSIADLLWKAARIDLVSSSRFTGPGAHQVAFAPSFGRATTSSLHSGGTSFSVRWRP